MRLSLVHRDSSISLASVLAQIQDKNVVRSSGRITATVLNDEGEPVREAGVCTFVRQANSQSTVCGSLTDKNGEVLIENVNFGEVAAFTDSRPLGQVLHPTVKYLLCDNARERAPMSTTWLEQRWHPA